MAARHLLNSSISENGNGKYCQHQQNSHHPQEQSNVYHHGFLGHTLHLQQPPANTLNSSQHFSSKMDDIRGDTARAYPPPLPPLALRARAQEGGAGVPVVMSPLPSHQPPAKSHRAQLSKTTLEAGATFLSPLEAALPGPSVAIPDHCSVHSYDSHYQQKMQLSGEECKTVFHHGVLLPLQPQNYPSAVVSTTCTVTVPVQTTCTSHHLKLFQQHEPLYGCGCGNCETFFSSPRHGYLSPLTHFSGEGKCLPPPAPSPCGHFSEATPSPSYRYCSSLPPLVQVTVRRLLVRGYIHN